MTCADSHRKRQRPALCALLLMLLTALFTWARLGEAQAKKADRDEPLEIEADDMDGVLDEDGVANLRGNVHIRQGSMNVHADLGTVTRKNGDFSKVVFQGKPATLDQINDDGTPMKARANRIEYDVHADIVVLTGDVFVQQERGTLTGNRVTYDLNTGRIDGGGDGGRIRMSVAPKKKSTDTKEGR